MGLNNAIDAIPRKTMVLFFLLDTSGSMEGSKIGAVNAAIEEVLPELRDLSAANADAEVKIAVMQFDNAPAWITPNGPEKVDDFHWQYVDAGGVTALGDACRRLNEKLSTKEFMHEATGSFAPAIFLLSDGEPTDDFTGGLDDLQKNNWFKAGIKVAVAIGDDANKTVLAQFTGSMESVLEVHSAVMLRKMIRFVSVRASQIASKSVNVKIGQARTVNTENSGGAASNNSGADSPAAVDATPPPASPPPAALSAKQQDLNEQIKVIAEEAADSGDDEW
jgi:uncharacterized protein YegL